MPLRTSLHPRGRPDPRSKPREAVLPVELFWLIVLIVLAMAICANPVHGG
jgi:hypothetical protein